MRESRDPEVERLDWRGAVLAAAGLGAVTWGLTAAGERGWTSPVVWSALAAGAALLAGFLVSQAREKHPMMPLTLYRSRTFSGANLLTLALYFGLTGALFFLPYELIASARLFGRAPRARPCCRSPWSRGLRPAWPDDWPTGSGRGRC